MALNSNYFVTSDLEGYFVSKDTGQPLANGTLTFYKDTSRNIRKEVFQLTGSPFYSYTSMGSQITLSQSGTPQNSGGDNVVIYYYPFDSAGNTELYYVVCADANGVEQFTREAWPNQSSGSSSKGTSESVVNQISNPTFTNVFLSEGVNVLTAGLDIQIGPNWFLSFSGNTQDDTVEITRVPIAGSSHVITNPPYVLKIKTKSTVSNCILKQRFNTNSGLWTSSATVPAYLSAGFLLKDEAGASSNIKLIYSDSTSTPIVIVDSTATPDYTYVSGRTQLSIPQSTDPNSGLSGYVEVYFSIPQGSEISISSVQLTPSLTDPVVSLPYDFDSSNRREAYQGDYYIPKIAEKGLESFLIGWDFSVAPFQFGNTGQTPINTAAYITDQTISQVTNTIVNWTANPQDGSLIFNGSIGDNFTLIQYIDGNLNGRRKISLNLCAKAEGVTARMYLLEGNSFPTLPNTIGSFVNNNTFVPALGWNYCNRSGLPNQAFFNLNNISKFQDYGAPGYVTNESKVYAVVVVFYFVSTQNIRIRSISAVEGDIPCKPLPKTASETLLQCQRFYEKSWVGANPPTNGDGLKFAGYVGQTLNQAALYSTSFTIKYLIEKYQSPGHIIYSAYSGAVGTIGYVTNFNSGEFTGSINLSKWAAPNIKISEVFYKALQSSYIHSETIGQYSSQGYFAYNYSADARIGK